MYWWLLELPTIRLLTRTRYVVSYSQRIKAIEVCWPNLINWRSKENLFHNVANRVSQHLIVVCEGFMNSWVDQMSSGPCFNIFRFDHVGERLVGESSEQLNHASYCKTAGTSL